MPRSGRYRAVVNYETRADTTFDDMGQAIESWAVAGTYRGEFTTPRGSEATVALQIKSLVNAMFKCRFPGTPFLTSGRLVEVTDPANPKVWNIASSVDPDGRRRELHTMLTELNPALPANASNL